MAERKIFTTAIFGVNAEPTKCLGFACPMQSNVCDICGLNPEKMLLQMLKGPAEEIARRFFGSELMSSNEAMDYDNLAAPTSRSRALHI